MWFNFSIIFLNIYNFWLIFTWLSIVVQSWIFEDIIFFILWVLLLFYIVVIYSIFRTFLLWKRYISDIVIFMLSILIFRKSYYLNIKNTCLCIWIYILIFILILFLILIYWSYIIFLFIYILLLLIIIIIYLESPFIWTSNFIIKNQLFFYIIIFLIINHFLYNIYLNWTLLFYLLAILSVSNISWIMSRFNSISLIINYDMFT